MGTQPRQQTRWLSAEPGPLVTDRGSKNHWRGRLGGGFHPFQCGLSCAEWRRAASSELPLNIPIRRMGLIFLGLPASPGSCEKSEYACFTCSWYQSQDRTPGPLPPLSGLFYPSFSPFCPKRTQRGSTASGMEGQGEAGLVLGPRRAGLRTKCPHELTQETPARELLLLGSRSTALPETVLQFSCACESPGCW